MRLSLFQLTAAVAACVLLSAGEASAQELTPVSTDADGTTVYSNVDARRWYGWQVLAVDVPLAGLFTVGAATETPGVLWGGYGAYVIGAPVVHVFNRNTPAAMLSVSTHLLLPIAGYSFGRVAVGKIASGTSLGTRTAIGMGASAVAATAIDVLYTSWGDYGDVTVVQTGKVVVTPWVGEKSGGVMVMGLGW